MAKSISLLVLVLIIRIVAVSQNRNDLEKQRTAILKEISETEDILGSIRKDKQQSLEVLDLLDKKINSRNRLIENIAKDQLKVEGKITELENVIGTLNSDIVKLKSEYGKVIWRSYLNRQKSSQLMYILSAKDLNQSYRRLKYLKQYADFRKRQVNNILDVQTDLRSKITELEIQKNEKVRLKQKTEVEKSNLNLELANKEKVVKNLKVREKELTADIRKKNSEADRINSKIEELIRKEIEESKARAAKLARESKKPSKKDSKNRISVNPSIGLTPDENVLSSAFKDNKGRLPWPTERGIITGFFGERNHPLYKTVKIRNNGIDITTMEGSYARAVFEGEVRYVFPILGANYSILIKHGSFYTLYTNIVDVQVKVGDNVKTKAILGRIFTDSKSNATVLHMELWENLNRLDPQLWLSKN